MKSNPRIEEYADACNYPGFLDEQKVELSLLKYCEALNIKRKVVRLRSGWALSEYPDLETLVDEVIAKIKPRDASAASDARVASAARDARAASDASAASAARDARDARDASTASDARDARDARAARDASDALDALDALDASAARVASAASVARAAFVARDASAARDARDASAASDALDARDARAARAASDARAALDALDASAARAARAARDALAASDASDARILFHCFAEWCIFRSTWMYWSWELSWLASTTIGARQLKLPIVLKWSEPIYEAFLAGCWLLVWTENTLYWIAKPEACKENNRLHSETGPACKNDIRNLYFLEGNLVPAYVVLKPEWITVKEIDDEQNAETRRILIQRMGVSRYLRESKAKILHLDHETCRKGAAPRALIQDDRGTKWLVGTDGSTKRVYYMPVPDEVTTCQQAHCAIAGFDESKILAKS